MFPAFSRGRILSFDRLSTRKHSKPRAERCLRLEVLEIRAFLTLQGDTLFPANNPWNQVISGAPVATNSATLVNSIGASSFLHPDFGTIYEGAYIGIPVTVVSGTQPKVNVVIDAYPDESDLVPVPIPTGAQIEGDPLPSIQNDGDRHLLIYDKDNNIAYELYNVHRPSETGDGQWHADSEAVWHMDQNWFRTPGDTSADAAGLPILPGLVRPDEVLDQGVINHALRFTVPRSQDAYVFPATHQAGDPNTNYPRMGERFRLKQSFDISGFSPANQVILRALKTYGMIVADNGSGWYLSGQPSSRWNDDELGELKGIQGNNFEAVTLTPRVTSLSQTSGSTSGGTSITINGQNFSGAAGQLTVLFGTVPAASISILSDTQLLVTSSAQGAGTVRVRVTSPYGAAAATTADQFTYTNVSGGVLGRWLFYNESKFDGSNAGANSLDDAAIASDKLAYLPGSGTATFASISSYVRGINGVMIDVNSNHGLLSASDFIFRVGTSNSPSGWNPAPAPSSILVRSGAGVGGSDRVELVWGVNAPKNTWLEVIFKGNDSIGGFNTNTGLASSDLFFFGSRIGDDGSGSATQAITSFVDEQNAGAHFGAGATITNPYDFDRSGVVTSVDSLAARFNAGAVSKIAIGNPPSGPAASPQTGIEAGPKIGRDLAGLDAVVSALAAPAIDPQASSRRFGWWGSHGGANVLGEARSSNQGTRTSTFAGMAVNVRAADRALNVAEFQSESSDDALLDDALLELLVAGRH